MKTLFATIISISFVFSTALAQVNSQITDSAPLDNKDGKNSNGTKKKSSKLVAPADSAAKPKPAPVENNKPVSEPEPLQPLPGKKGEIKTH